VPELSILMPVYNERGTVARAIEEVQSAELPVDGVEFVVIDDGSTDGTRELLRELAADDGFRLVEHPRNKGKGAAIRTGLAEATGRWTTILDADLEYSPASLAELLGPLIDGYADAVYGTRAFQAHSAYSFWYVAGNKAVTFACNLLYNAWLSDIMTCHKVMPTELFQSLNLCENGFGIEPEITARLLQSKRTIFEVPIPYRARRREAGKKLTGYDGLRTLRTLARCRVTRPTRRPPPPQCSKPAASPTPGSRSVVSERTRDGSVHGTGDAQQSSPSAGTK
jgi:dolichol-phosphate hexosyltransferase